VLEGLRQERGKGPTVTATTDLDEAVDGASVVLCAIRVGGLEGRILDEAIPLRSGVLGQETVGPGGICFALRTIPAMLEIAELVERRAPGAWFVNFTNPAGLVTEVLQDVMGDRAVGICDSPEALCGRVAAALGRPRSELCFDYAGINHLGWLLAVDAGSGDLLPGLLRDERRLGRLDETRLFGDRHLREMGMIPNEYLVYIEQADAIADSFRRAGETRGEVLARQQAGFYERSAESPAAALRAWRETRDARHGTYMVEAWGTRPPADDDGEVEGDTSTEQGPGETGYAAVAAAFLNAIFGGEPQDIVLNVANGGRLPFLPADAVVEVPCLVSGEGARTRPGRHLPSEQADLVARVKNAERLTIQAAREGSRDLALEALFAHPLVRTRAAARDILDAYLSAFPGLAVALA
jgi:6-phospho-beta-glucosidase